MTPVPHFARVQAEPTALEMALHTAHDDQATMMECQVALKVMLAQGDPSIPEHRTAFWSLHRTVGRWLGHKAAPAKWEAP